MSSSHVSIYPRQPSSVMTVTNPSEAQPTATKKKFGKNLNSLTKRPPLPTSFSLSGGVAPNGIPATHPRTNGGSSASPSGRNGLLLLSAKRPSLTSASGGSGSLGGGLLGSKPSTAPRQLGRSESMTTTTVMEMVGARASAHDEMFRKAAGSMDDQTAAVAQTQQAWKMAGGQQHDSAASSFTTHTVSVEQIEDRKESVVSTNQYDETTMSSPGAPGVSLSSPRNNGSHIYSSRYHYSDDTGDVKIPFDVSKQGDGRFMTMTFNVADSSNGGSSHRRHEGHVPFHPRDEHHQSRLYREMEHPYSSSGRNTEADRDWRASNVHPDDQSRVRERFDAHASGPQAPRPEKAERTELVTKAGEDSHFSSEDVDPHEATNNSAGTKPVDEQVEFMSRLARERAEKRRAEEAARALEQKSRAARRLKELDEKKPPLPGETGTSFLPKISTSASSQGEFSETCDLSSVSTDPPSHTTFNNRVPPTFQSVSEPEKSTRRRRTGPSSEIVLERLGRAKRGGAIAREETSQSSNMVNGASSSTPRKLFDPNRTYSSLVGGSLHPPADGAKTEGEPPRNPHDFMYGNEKVYGASLSSASHFRRHPDEQSNHSAPRTQQLIQLSSYEDRDRGERSPSAGPRMLFDPKSGEMVVAPTPRGSGADDPGGCGGKGMGSRKDRGTKSRGRVKVVERGAESSRSKIENAFLPSGRPTSVDEKGSQSDGADAKGARRNKTTKVSDDTVAVRGKERRRAERGDTSMCKEGKSFDPSAPSFDSGAVHLPSRISGNQGTPRHMKTNSPHWRLPRTCGVLYKLDHKGNFVCTDGCDADHGYGAHSVPGGRLRNPNAHAAFVERQKKLQKTNSVPTPSNDGEGYFRDASGEGEIHYAHYHVAFANGVFPKTPYVVSHQAVMAHGAESWNTAAYGIPSKDQSHDYESQTLSDLHRVEGGGRSLDFAVPVKVGRDEPIEILAGDEPPTLHADASPWAPSKATLAAASAAAAVSREALGEDRVHDSARGASDHLVVLAADMLLNEDCDDDHDDSGNLSCDVGLGFDPTRNMDTVMMSPSVRAETVDDDDYDDHINLTNLLSESDGDDDDVEDKHQFNAVSPPTQFLSSSTWSTGTGVAMGALGNWDVLASRDTTNGISRAEASATTPASFLSLSPLAGESTWGSVGLGPSLVSLNSRSPMTGVGESVRGAKHVNG